MRSASAALVLGSSAWRFNITPLKVRLTLALRAAVLRRAVSPSRRCAPLRPSSLALEPFACDARYQPCAFFLPVGAASSLPRRFSSQRCRAFRRSICLALVRLSSFVLHEFAARHEEDIALSESQVFARSPCSAQNAAQPFARADSHRRGTWPARRCGSSSASRAKRHAGARRSAQTLGRIGNRTPYSVRSASPAFVQASPVACFNVTPLEVSPTLALRAAVLRRAGSPSRRCAQLRPRP